MKYCPTLCGKALGILPSAVTAGVGRSHCYSMLRKSDLWCLLGSSSAKRKQQRTLKSLTRLWPPPSLVEQKKVTAGAQHQPASCTALCATKVQRVSFQVLQTSQDSNLGVFRQNKCQSFQLQRPDSAARLKTARTDLLDRLTTTICL